MDIHPYVISARSELDLKIIFSWKMIKSIHSKICFNIYYLQKLYLNENLNLYYQILCEISKSMEETNQCLLTFFRYARLLLEYVGQTYVKDKLGSQIYLLSLQI